MIFGINTTSDISKLLYEISRAVRRPIKPSVFTLNIKALLQFCCYRRKYRYMTCIIYLLCLLISLSAWKWLYIACDSSSQLQKFAWWEQTNQSFSQNAQNETQCLFFPFSLYRQINRCQQIKRKPVCLQTGSILKTFSQFAGQCAGN